MSTRVIGIGAVLLVGFVSVLGCNKLEKQECDKLRDEGFELINAAQHCGNDADCFHSKWPGCARAVNPKTVASTTAIAEKFTKGECEETKMTCKEPPEAYCKQGLCVLREKGAPEGAANPAGGIK